jgi:hypothetical protein
MVRAIVLAIELSDVAGIVMDEFSQARIRLIRDLAEKADRFTKRRLLDLVARYDDPKHRPLNDVPHPLANLSSESNR